jgi:hypothetical protein
MIENCYTFKNESLICEKSKYHLHNSFINKNCIKNIFYFNNFYFTVYTKNINNFYKTFVYISDNEGNFITENKNTIKNPVEIYLDDKNLIMTDIGNDIEKLHFRVLHEIFYNLVISNNCYDFERFNMDKIFN